MLSYIDFRPRFTHVFINPLQPEVCLNPEFTLALSWTIINFHTYVQKRTKFDSSTFSYAGFLSEIPQILCVKLVPWQCIFLFKCASSHGNICILYSSWHGNICIKIYVINEKCGRWNWWSSIAWAVFLLAQTYQEHNFVRIAIVNGYDIIVYLKTVACSTGDTEKNVQASNQIHKNNKVIKTKPGQTILFDHIHI